jgi:hypothetical protein
MTEFSELGLSPTTLQAVADSGYTTATPIQAQAIPVALSGLDVLGIAQTGTGKTAAFTLPMVDRLSAGRAKARMPRSLVIEPTRELADQVAAAFERYAKGTKLTWALLIGGVSFGDQERKLDRGVDVLIATPGRLLDHVERGKLLLTGVQIMVVDEADRMLDMGFIPDIERIFKLTPPKKQTLFFSATMPPEITRLTKQFLNDPVRIEASKPATTNENIAQHVVRIPSSEPAAKRLALRALGRQVAAVARLRRRRHPRRPGPGDADADARELPQRQSPPSRRLRRGSARARHPRRQPRVQLRRPPPRRRLCPPHRTHRPGGQDRRDLYDRDLRRRAVAGQGPEADRPVAGRGGSRSRLERGQERGPRPQRRSRTRAPRTVVRP